MDAPELDYVADLTEEDHEFWRQVGERGEESLLGQCEETAGWGRSGMIDLDVPADDRPMPQETFGEAIRSGPWGFVDDFLAASTDWGFAVENVLAPARVALARDDPSVPRVTANGWPTTSPTGRSSGSVATTAAPGTTKRWS